MSPRAVLFIFVAAFAVIGAALAQDTQTSPGAARFSPKYDRLPTANDFARHYPPGALTAGMAGYAVLCCKANADRTLNCTGALEYPEGYEFGAAAVSFSGEFRLAEEDFGAALARPSIEVPVRFNIANARNSDDLEANRERIRQAAEAFCPDFLRAPFQIASPMSEAEAVAGAPLWEISAGATPEMRYPRAALDAGESGAVVLCCTPDADRSLSCATVVESPGDNGFADVAMSMAADLRMTQTAYDSFRASGAPLVPLPFRFTVEGAGREAAQRLYARLQGEGEALCRQAWGEE